MRHGSPFGVHGRLEELLGMLLFWMLAKLQLAFKDVSGATYPLLDCPA